MTEPKPRLAIGDFMLGDEDWNTRPAPELPEGYREAFSGKAELHAHGEVHGWRIVATWNEKYNYMSFPGNRLDLEHAPALAIWLQRRAKND